ncbi:MAG: aminoacyl-histidine dipeptidase, partial [Lachnospiraceae bacterium]|nr:aminoacyl-histidine dipeptidase [Lachnospiraceae bacterium]
VLDGLQPENVFQHFEQLCRIPHGSGNVKQISDHLKNFAEERALFCEQDALGNVVIIREASPEREQEEPYILQAHMDMVAVTAQGSQIDMKKEPLRLRVDGDKIYAEETSLGGDDGIGVAYCLALLDAKDLSLPRLEVILTVDEETGMEGATGIDLSMLRGRRMINLDQEEEGIFITSCAGGAKVDVIIPVEKDTENADKLVEIKITGLLGGHSGIEIDKGRGNANYLLGQVLRAVGERCRIRLVSMNGGMADNAIPREASAVLAVEAADLPAVETLVKEQEEKIREQMTAEEKQVQIVCRQLTESGNSAVMTEESTKKALACLLELPNGVTAMSKDVEGLVETSLNLGILALEEEGLHLQYAVRSSVDQEKENLCRQMSDIAGKSGAAVSVKNPYPGWAYRKDSPLREKMVQIYEDMYGKPPVLQAIHAGLECGILAGKLPGLDCVSIGPDLFDVHTAQESMSIASVKRVWEYLLTVLTQTAG